MTVLTGMLDVVAVLGLLSLATLALRARDGFAAISWFIVFGLVMALVWVRLRAPDLALAEAAIGAGLTGALLVMTWRHLHRHGAANPDGDAP